MKRKTFRYWCVPHREAGCNARFKTRREAFAFWRKNNDGTFAKPGKVEIGYYSLLDLVDNCLAGETTVDEPIHDNPLEVDH